MNSKVSRAGNAIRLSRGTRSKVRSEEHTSELQSLTNLVCRLLLEKKKAHSELQSLTNIVCRLLLEKRKLMIGTILSKALPHSQTSCSQRRRVSNVVMISRVSVQR